MFYPALDVADADHDLVLAVADDFAPSAVEQHGSLLTIFFPDTTRRDGARAAIARAWPSAVTTAREIDDEDWARRSQQNLRPVTVGCITIFPSSESRDARPSPTPPASAHPGARAPIAIVIEPSMGFGTGHHATTRLCLAALQAIDLTGRVLIDLGTGSGVLAIAGRLLGAARAIGIDDDPDAVHAACANLELNATLGESVRFVKADLASWLNAPTFASDVSRPGGDAARVITANLTGALLVREAGLLAAAVGPDGILIVSGLLAAEREPVGAALQGTAALRLAGELEEDGWLGLIFNQDGRFRV